MGSYSKIFGFLALLIAFGFVIYILNNSQNGFAPNDSSAGELNTLNLSSRVKSKIENNEEFDVFVNVVVNGTNRGQNPSYAKVTIIYDTSRIEPLEIRPASGIKIAKEEFDKENSRIIFDVNTIDIKFAFEGVQSLASIRFKAIQTSGSDFTPIAIDLDNSQLGLPDVLNKLSSDSILNFYFDPSLKCEVIITPPNYCQNGEIIDVGKDENGCDQLPQCRTKGAEVKLKINGTENVVELEAPAKYTLNITLTNIQTSKCLFSENIESGQSSNTSGASFIELRPEIEFRSKPAGTYKYIVSCFDDNGNKISSEALVKVKSREQTAQTDEICRADYNLDGIINEADFSIFALSFDKGKLDKCDLDLVGNDCEITKDDLNYFEEAYESGENCKK